MTKVWLTRAGHSCVQRHFGATVQVSVGAGFVVALPGWSRLIVQSRLSVMLTFVPTMVQPPETVMMTGSPELAAASTVKCTPTAARVGGGLTKNTVWSVLARSVTVKPPSR